VVIFIDPFDKSVGLRPPQGHADIVFVSHNHKDHNNAAALKDNPLIIDLPGEYSIKGINAVGIDSFHDQHEGAERGHNTVFVIESEDIKICHLGDLGTDLGLKQTEEINGVDILLMPVGGKYTIDGKKAAEIARKLEPAVVIPMHYKMKGMNSDIVDEKKFCSEMGKCPNQRVSKLTFKKKDLGKVQR
jgi:L-ascorbate metabolism protein UlaG (beta-lactamase superfamily)